MVNFKVGQSAPANTFLAIWMADAAGFYRDRGLQIDVVPMVGGRQAGPSLTNRQIQLMHIGLSSVVRANAAGASLVAVGSLSKMPLAPGTSSPRWRRTQAPFPRTISIHP